MTIHIPEGLTASKFIESVYIALEKSYSAADSLMDHWYAMSKEQRHWFIQSNLTVFWFVRQQRSRARQWEKIGFDRRVEECAKFFRRLLADERRLLNSRT